MLAIQYIRNSKTIRIWSFLMVVSFVMQMATSTVALAMGGPAQQENVGFSSGGGNMVDLFSGDFKYDIPVMNVGGYPINLSYNSSVTMDQEASIVGLGWNISSHGSVNRSVRGMADDYDGVNSLVKTTTSMASNTSMTLTLGVKPELFGFDLKYKSKGQKKKIPGKGGPKLDLGFTYSNYNGFNINLGAGVHTRLTKNEANYKSGLGLNSSADGFDLSASLSAVQARENKKKGTSYNMAGGLGVSINNLSGLRFNALESLSPLTIGNLGIGSKSYFPSNNLAFTTKSGQFSFTAEGTAFGADAGLNATVFFIDSRLKNNKEEVEEKAYGYLYHKEGQADEKSLLDYNNSFDNQVIVGENGTKDLPLTQMMYDIYSIQGHGVGGTFRPHFSRPVDVSPAKVSNDMFGLNGHFEVGGGALAETAWGAGGSGGFNNSGPWNDKNNPIREDFTVDHTSYTTPLNESIYFKRIGESTRIDEDYYSSIEKNKTLYPKEDGKSLEELLSVDKDDASFVNVANAYRSKRDKRKQIVDYYTNEQVTDLLNEEEIRIYNFPSELEVETDSSSHISYNRASNKSYGVFKVRSGDGSVYSYGLPLYTTENQVQFNAEGLSKDCATGLVNYTRGVDNSIDNENGISKYYSKKEIPSYAHSFMLTDIKSADYVDADKDGKISELDFGTAYKFSYNKVDNVKWRIPHGVNKANFAEGFHSDQNDDVASYTYGEKDQAYLHSLESKTHIAYFYYQDRYDGIGANENGDTDLSKRAKALIKIELFSKKKRTKEITDGLTPIAEKTVHFEYNYSLCQNIPSFDNNEGHTDGVFEDVAGQSGKLTLKKVYFTYKDSKKGKANPYLFYYGDADHDKATDAGLNPDYDLKAYDRWGMYKPNPLNGQANCYSENSALSNAENPYVDQNNYESTQNYAKAWLMSTIDLPTGATMAIDYESDDYAYVQEEVASEMMTPKGLSDEPLFSESSLLYENDQDFTSNSYVFFELRKPVYGSSVENASKAFREKYIGFKIDGTPDDEIYFNCYTKVSRDDISSGKLFDYVKGYAKLELSECKVDETTHNPEDDTYSRAYIKLANVSSRKNGEGDKDANPISKAGWQMAWQELRPLVVPGSSSISIPNIGDSGPSEDDYLGFINNVKGRVTDMASLFKSYYKVMREKHVADEVVLDKSFFRMRSPEKKKLGGGVRVKRILVNDNWQEFTLMGETNSFGQEYSYTTLSQGQEISSGVASWEPFIGGDENTNRRLLNVEIDKKVLATNDGNNLIGPHGEMFMSSGAVGYSKVTVKAINPDANIVKHATGRTVHEFYTAKDYPVIVNQSDISPDLVKKGIIVKPFSQVKALQGYTMEFNNMHGQVKSKKTYAENSNDVISGMVYSYKSQEGNSRKLSNEVDFLIPENNDAGESGTMKVETGLLGIDVDVTYYHSATNNKSYSVGFENQANVLPIPFGVVPTFWIPASVSEESFRMGVVTKMINRQGILEKIEVIDGTSSTFISNKVWDAETGNVLMTSSQNEYSDPLFKLDYPAYWVYEALGPHYRNQKAQFTDNVTNGLLGNSLNESYLFEGDVLSVAGVKAWVVSIDGQKKLVDKEGLKITASTNSIMIVQSGFENLSAATVQSVSVKSDPVVNTGAERYIKIKGYTEVINASAVIYDDHWQTLRESGASSAYIESSWESSNFWIDQRASSTVQHLERNIYVDQFSDLVEDKFLSLIQNQDFIHESVTVPMHPSCGDVTIEFCGIVDIRDFQHYRLHKDILYNDVINRYKGGFTNASDILTRTYAYIEFEKPDCFTIGKGYYVNDEFFQGPFEGQSTNSEPFPNATVVNPYFEGVKGNWTSKNNLVYRDHRKVGNNTREGGVMASSFNEYWEISNNQFVHQNSGKWISTQISTKRSPYGFSLESKDPLNRAVSSHVGYDNNLIISQGVNTSYSEFFTLAFEDDNQMSEIPELTEHSEFVDLSGITTDETYSHTGYASMKVSSSNVTSIDVDIAEPVKLEGGTDYPLYVDACEALGSLSLEEGKEYQISYWVRKGDATFGGVKLYTNTNELNTEREVEVRNIEGWSLVTESFETPCGMSTFKIEFLAVSGDVWFDDVKLQPRNSEVISYVYDPNDYRLLAELDAQNFATFYEYDEENTLIRIKKETKKGIQTLTESRSGLRKKEFSTRVGAYQAKAD